VTPWLTQGVPARCPLQRGKLQSELVRLARVPPAFSTPPFMTDSTSCWRLTFLLFAVAATVPATLLSAAERPKLIVVVSVDQLCEDYLIRFADNFSDEGAFRRVEREGARYTQCHHRHAFTVTAPGHAVQFTGAYPNTHGIIGNNWFDRTTGKGTYCCDDPSVEVVGLPGGKPMSPKNLLVETVGDVLKLATAGRSKVCGVAIKDRAAILMTGHNADGAYWLEGNVWVTSTYYRRDLPGYLRVLNEQQAIERFRGRTWDLLLAKEKYHNSGPDENDWENPPKGWTSAFPHKLAGPGELKPLEYGEHVLFSPFGNELTLEAAREIVIHEELGQDEFPDVLCINFSSNDYVGHAFGPHSLEVEDMTYRTDLQLGEFLRWLDEQVGAGNWTFALTADHAVAPIVEYARQFRLPAVRSPLGRLADVQGKLETLLRSQLGIGTEGKPLIQKVEDNQVYLQHDHPAFRGEHHAAGGPSDKFRFAQALVRDWLLAQPYVVAARTRDELTGGGEGKLNQQLHRAFHPRRSGDVLYVLAPYCVPGSRGTTHGSPWQYDTHVPCLLLGRGIARGTFDRAVSPACLASTVAELVGVDYPSANVEQPLHEALSR
jgi:predicted AlkP superfamily pyrophosphatase or phosphodiesterase